MFTTDDLDFFLTHIWDDSFQNNNGGMASPDMFSLFYMLRKLAPKVIVESGVWNGLSTKLIRKTVGPDAIILCLDPRPIPPSGFKDSNPNTIYYVGSDFCDFEKLDLSKYDPATVFAFFDCHTNAALRLYQSKQKHLTHLFFNDNYPRLCGSHYTLEHLYTNDTRKAAFSEKDRAFLIGLIKTYEKMPNIYPGKVRTEEGEFDCTSFFTSGTEHDDSRYAVFKTDQAKYRWNTYVELV